MESASSPALSTEPEAEPESYVRGAGARDVPAHSRWCKTLSNKLAPTRCGPGRPALRPMPLLT